MPIAMRWWLTKVEKMNENKRESKLEEKIGYCEKRTFIAKPLNI